MEPLDTDLEYRVPRRRARSKPGSRLNLMLAFPIIGALIVLFFISAALFQFDISGAIDSLVGLMLVLFFAFIIGLFWALAPQSE